MIPLAQDRVDTRERQTQSGYAPLRGQCWLDLALFKLHCSDMRHDCSHFPKSADAKFLRVCRGVLFVVIPVLTFFPAAGFDEEPVAGKSEVPKSEAHEVSRTVPPNTLTLQQKISAVHYRALTKHPPGSPEIAKEVEDGFRKLIADYPNEPLLWQEMLRLAEDAGSGDDKKRILT
jgi:hypothetical protein